jgi:hypothetical protein
VDADCIPPISCQEPHCVNGNCVFVNGPSCCEKDADCDDKSACTEDLCQGGGCKHQSQENVEGCCSTATDCKTTDPCKVPHCVSTKCVFSDKAGCGQ